MPTRRQQPRACTASVPGKRSAQFWLPPHLPPVHSSTDDAAIQEELRLSDERQGREARNLVESFALGAPGVQKWGPWWEGITISLRLRHLGSGLPAWSGQASAALPGPVRGEARLPPSGGGGGGGFVMQCNTLYWGCSAQSKPVFPVPPAICLPSGKPPQPIRRFRAPYHTEGRGSFSTQHTAPRSISSFFFRGPGFPHLEPARMPVTPALFSARARSSTWGLKAGLGAVFLPAIRDQSFSAP
jgi:hypothetical protein